jgi:branched-chain amino acid transport system ATP-binding protein
VLEISGLRVSYGPTVAVRGVSFAVPDRGVVALLGANGAGKSSILRAISQLVRHEGSVAFDGRELRGADPAEVARLGVVHVPEGRRIFPTLTVEENLRMGENARRRRPARFTRDDIYGLFPALVPLRRRDGWQLSGGEQQMLAIGRGLLAAPLVLLLDEPSLGLAPVITQSVYAVLRDVASTTPLLLVEQHTTEALTLADHGYVVANGSIVLSGTAGELRNQAALLETYLG